jgi:hypothetical protein
MKSKNILSMGQLMRQAGVVIVFLFFIIAILIDIQPFLDGKNDLMDFGSFYASGLKIWNGENPYDPNSEYIFEIDFPQVGAGGKMMNLNPPISVVLFRPLSQFDPHRSLIVWQVMSAILYAGIIFVLTATYKQTVPLTIFLWTFTLAGFWHTLVLGQIYILLLLFTVLGWIFLRGGKYILAGIAIGLVVALKPNFILWPIFLLFSGYYVTFFVSLLSSLIVSVIPLLFYGTHIYAQWLEASALHPETLIMPGNNSILGLTTRFSSIPLGIVISIILVVILLILSKRKISNHMEKSEYVSALGIMASLLASPISWTGYTMLLLPIFFSLKKWTIPAIVSAAILAIPFAIVLQLFQTSFVNFVLFGWLYGWGLILLVGDVVAKTIMTSSIQTN